MNFLLPNLISPPLKTCPASRLVQRQVAFLRQIKKSLNTAEIISIEVISQNPRLLYLPRQ